MKILPVRNPRSGEYDYQITPPTAEELAARCAALRQGQAHWQAIEIERRIAALQAWKVALQEARAAIVTALVADTGRLNESVLELDSLLGMIDRWCRQAPGLLAPGERRDTAIPSIQLSNAFVPYQLVGVISPWNFPLLLALIDAIPALLAGCAVMVKPSEITPRFIEPLVRTITTVPDLRDALAFIPGAGETGATLIEHVDLVCFTGSVPTGRKVAEAAARRFIPAFLELGGKDPAIVLEGADLERAASAILWGAVVNCGQSCLSIERVYVAEPILAPFVERLAAKAQRLGLAYPTLESGVIGPIIAERQVDVIAAHLCDAVIQGAAVHGGGVIEEHGGGRWCRPTVLTKVDHSMLIMREETFGPVIPVMSFHSVAEAIHLANDTTYGLSAAVFAATEAEARAVAEHLEAGAISINDAALTALMHEGAKNAFKFSGLGGSRMGPAALKRFMRQKALLINTSTGPDPWWFKMSEE
jgi:acyl-CoA reductase-like NAD-dependent aldehyde dehydrogenase